MQRDVHGWYPSHSCQNPALLLQAPGCSRQISGHQQFVLPSFIASCSLPYHPKSSSFSVFFRETNSCYVAQMASNVQFSNPCLLVNGYHLCLSCLAQISFLQEQCSEGFRTLQMTFLRKVGSLKSDFHSDLQLHWWLPTLSLNTHLHSTATELIWVHLTHGEFRTGVCSGHGHTTFHLLYKQILQCQPSLI